MLTEKDYCDYDTCVALKELGYNQYTSLRSYAGKGGVRLWDFDGEPNYKEGELIALSDMYDIPRDGNEVAAPSLYETQKWLREEKKIIIEATFDLMYKGQPRFSWRVLYNLTQHKGAYYTFDSINSKEDYDSYEEALTKGLCQAVKILKENGYGKDSNICQ